MQHPHTWRVLLILGIYLVIRYVLPMFVPGSQLVLKPITMLVTFLHELGHAVAAILTGGGVQSLQVNADGSGVTWTYGGSRAITLMGGYIGSAIFGNVLFYIGSQRPQWARGTLIALGVVMIVTAFAWFSAIQSFVILLLFGGALLAIAHYTRWHRDLLMFFGLAAVLYILQDFRVGPSSDLKAYAEQFPLIPVSFWMYTWLAVAVLIFGINLRMIWRRESQHKFN